MRKVFAHTWLVLGVWLLAACGQSETPITQLVVSVTLGSELRARVRQLVVQVYDVEGLRLADERSFALVKDEASGVYVGVPFSFGVAKSEADRLLLVFRGYEQNNPAPILEQKLIARFGASGRSRLSIELQPGCLDRLCEDKTQTCVATGADDARCEAVPSVISEPEHLAPEAGLAEVDAATQSPTYMQDAASAEVKDAGHVAADAATVTPDATLAKDAAQDASRDASVDAALVDAWVGADAADPCLPDPCAATHRHCSRSAASAVCRFCVPGYLENAAGLCVPTAWIEYKVLGETPGVLLIDGQPDCPSTQDHCNVEVEAGKPLQVTLQTGGPHVRVTWTGVSCGSARSCSFVPSAALSFSVKLELTNNIVFLTSERWSPDQLGGIEAAHAKCKTAATAAGLHGQNYFAWLSGTGPTAATSDDIHAVTRIQNARGWVRTDGMPVADTVSELLTKGPLYPIMFDEHGARAADEAVASATGRDGKLFLQDYEGTCADFTRADGGATRGGFGNATGVNWTSIVPYGCTNTPLHLYCFGTDSQVPLARAATAGRRAFVSRAMLAGNVGVSRMDQLCAAEALSAGLPGSYRTLVATTTTPAHQRFNLNGLTWVRTDGVAWLASASDLQFYDRALTGLDLDATGALVLYAFDANTSTRAWTGRDGTTVSAASTCHDWTDDTGTAGGYGAVDINGAASLAYLTGECGTTFHVYCLQE